MSQENHLQAYILAMAEALRGDQELDYDIVVASLQQFRVQLEAMHSSYADSEEDSLQEGMSDMLACYYGAIDDLEKYIEEPSEELLDSAVELAQQGNRLIVDLTEEIQGSLDDLSGFH